MPPLDIVKLHKPLYAPSAKHPAIVEVPDLAFLMVDGRGDPETAEPYHQALEALYSAAYTLKFSLKKTDPERDFKVAPLEGLWWADDRRRPRMADLQRDRDSWNWTMMIAVPDAVTAERSTTALEAAARKKDLPAAPLLRLERLEEGLAAQIMHLGPYADEAPTIERLHEWVAAAGLRAVGSPPRDLPGRPSPHRPGAAQDRAAAPGSAGLTAPLRPARSTRPAGQRPPPTRAPPKSDYALLQGETPATPARSSGGAS